MPAPNESRRALLADTAIRLLASDGAHGLTHRAVEREAGVPTGTASNYFRTREALLVVAAERIAELHVADMDGAAAAPPWTRRPRTTAARAVALLTASVLDAATLYRDRYLAVFELRLESRHRPAVAAALDRTSAALADVTARHHAQLGLDIPVERIPVLMSLYGGVLFLAVTGPHPPEPAAVRELVVAIVRGALD